MQQLIRKPTLRLPYSLLPVAPWAASMTCDLAAPWYGVEAVRASFGLVAAGCVLALAVLVLRPLDYGRLHESDPNRARGLRHAAISGMGLLAFCLDLWSRVRSLDASMPPRLAMLWGAVGLGFVAAAFAIGQAVELDRLPHPLRRRAPMRLRVSERA